MTFITILIIFVLIAAYSLADIAESADEPSADSAKDPGWIMEGLGPLFSSYVPPGVLTIVDIPSVGCSKSLLDAKALGQLMTAMPAEQSEVLLKLLGSTTNVWQAQLYMGDLGAGVCLPARNALALLPMSAAAAMKALFGGELPASMTQHQSSVSAEDELSFAA